MDSFGSNVATPAVGSPSPIAQVTKTRLKEDEYDRDANVSEPKKWSSVGGVLFSATGETTNMLPSACYKLVQSQAGIFFRKMDLHTDNILRLPDSATDRVLDGIEKFWNSKGAFADRGYLFKRGILLTGDPGGGKTSCIHLLIDQLIKRGGIVLMVGNPELATMGLTMLRDLEPDRPLICILEDMDELIRYYGESAFLSLLDGENQINNVVYIGTTNYPQNIDKRFVNRPSRFDEIIEIQMPSPAAREAYLRAKTKDGDLTEEQLMKWVGDTDGFSIAHMREIYVSVFCLDRPYKEVIDRLHIMRKAKFREGNGAKVGF